MTHEEFLNSLSPEQLAAFKQIESDFMETVLMVAKAFGNSAEAVLSVDRVLQLLRQIEN